MSDCVAEVCCGSYYDVKQAAAGGAGRVELNCGLHLGGLTPSLAELSLAKRDFQIQIIAMVRPRGAGFCYSEEDFQVMEADCELLMREGADGIAFGCLNEKREPDRERNRRLLDIVKSFGGEAVFHRAFDCCADRRKATETLISLGIDRILTSGAAVTAFEGRELLRQLNREYGSSIQFLAGGGIHAGNADRLIRYTGIRQVHSSCKAWLEDRTTKLGAVSFGYGPSSLESRYDVVSRQNVEELIKSIEDIWEKGDGDVS